MAEILHFSSATPIPDNQVRADTFLRGKGWISSDHRASACTWGSNFLLVLAHFCLALAHTALVSTFITLVIPPRAVLLSLYIWTHISISPFHKETHLLACDRSFLFHLQNPIFCYSSKAGSQVAPPWAALAHGVWALTWTWRRQGGAWPGTPGYLPSLFAALYSVGHTQSQRGALTQWYLPPTTITGGPCNF